MEESSGVITKEDLANQCEQIQDDLMCILDGIEDRIITNACQAVVDRFKVLKAIVSNLDENDLCVGCRVEFHDVCSMTQGCSCCNKTAQQLLEEGG